MPVSVRNCCRKWPDSCSHVRKALPGDSPRRGGTGSRRRWRGHLRKPDPRESSRTRSGDWSLDSNLRKSRKYSSPTEVRHQYTAIVTPNRCGSGLNLSNEVFGFYNGSEIYQSSASITDRQSRSVYGGNYPGNNERERSNCSEGGRRTLPQQRSRHQEASYWRPTTTILKVPGFGLGRPDVAGSNSAVGK